MKDAPGFFEKLRGYGDIAYFRFAWHHDYLVNTPELIREVLITKAEHFNKTRLFKRVFDQPTLFTSDGNFWRRQRKLLQPAFHTGRIGNYFALMEAKIVLVTIAQHWRLEFAPNQTIVPEQLTAYPSGGLPMVVKARKGQLLAANA